MARRNGTTASCSRFIGRPVSGRRMPLGLPVVPDEYWMMSPSVSSGSRYVTISPLLPMTIAARSGDVAAKVAGYIDTVLRKRVSGPRTGREYEQTVQPSKRIQLPTPPNRIVAAQRRDETTVTALA